MAYPMNDRPAITLPTVTLRNVKSVSKSDTGAGYADLTIRLQLGEAYQDALPLLTWCQENGHPLRLELSQVQLPFQQPEDDGQMAAPLEEN